MIANVVKNSIAVIRNPYDDYILFTNIHCLALFLLGYKMNFV